MTNHVGLATHIGPAGWRVARSLLVVVSVVALVSFGGQLFLAPVLLPAQWFVARHSQRPGRVLFAVLAALLLGEIGWMLGYVVSTETTAVVIGLATASVSGPLFYFSTAQPR